MTELLKQILNEYRIGAITIEEATEKIKRLVQDERYRL